MDPEACIQRIENNIRNADIGEAIAALWDYAQWRIRGGFEPRNGDQRVATLAATLADIAS